MTAGEADVNSNIRFQSACTVPAPQRSEEVLKLCCMTKSLRNDWKQLSRSPQLMLQLASLLQMMGAGRIAEQGCTSQRRSWMKSCHIVFDAPVFVRAGRLLRCPRGAGEQSGFGISHSLSSQGLWLSADFTANCSLIPSPLLFGQLWIFSWYESNSVRHPTVQPDNVRGVVWRMEEEDHTGTFVSSFDFDIYGVKEQKQCAKWPRYMPFFLSCVKYVLICSWYLSQTNPPLSEVKKKVSRDTLTRLQFGLFMWFVDNERLVQNRHMVSL